MNGDIFKNSKSTVCVQNYNFKIPLSLNLI